MNRCFSISGRALSSLLLFSAHDEGQRLAFTPLILLQQLNAIVAVKLNGPPVPLVANQQRTLLQAALAVGLGGHAELVDVLGQVLLHCRALCLRPGTLQNATLPWQKAFEEKTNVQPEWSVVYLAEVQCQLYLTSINDSPIHIYPYSFFCAVIFNCGKRGEILVLPFVDFLSQCL